MMSGIEGQAMWERLRETRDDNTALRSENDRLRRALALAEETRDAAQQASTRDLLDARNMRLIVNAPPYEAKALADVSHERRLADVKHGAIAGRIGTPLGTGGERWENIAKLAKAACDGAFAKGEGTWGQILHEEFAEAMAESDPVKLRAELVQLASVAIGIVEAIDRVAAGEKR